MTRPFTGWHMLSIMILFFAVVIAVNVTMARYAVGTFGGAVVDNSYVASQRFNGWLTQGRAQARLGWRIAAAVGPGGVLRITAVDARGTPITGRIAVIARHPLGRTPDRAVAMAARGQGFAASAPLPAGRWQLLIVMHAHGRAARFEAEVRA